MAENFANFLKEAGNFDRKILNRLLQGERIIRATDNFDPRYLKEKYWNIDNYGNFTNNWIRFYIDTNDIMPKQPQVGDSNFTYQDVETAGPNVPMDQQHQYFVDRVRYLNKLSYGTDMSRRGNGALAMNSQVIDFICFGVKIDITRNSNLIKTDVKGMHPVYQRFGEDSFSIKVTFSETGTFFWQHNSYNLSLITGLLDLGVPISVTNIQLNEIYNIRKIVPESYTVNQDQRYYAKSGVVLNLRSHYDQDIIIKSTLVL